MAASMKLFFFRPKILSSSLVFQRVISQSLTTETNESSYTDSSEHFTNDGLLYDSHIRTSGFQKMLLSVGSATMSIMDPSRDDMIAVLSETTGQLALRKMRDQMWVDDEGSAILTERPRINSTTLDYNYMKSLPKNTLAGTYLKFLDDNGVSPDTRQPVHFVDDEELAYVVQRYREVHDMVHSVLAMPTNMLGEVAVKWVEGIQTGLPMCILGGLFGAIRLSKKQRHLYKNYYLPWALKCGHESQPLMNLYYERHWDEPIDELRLRMRIPSLVINNPA